MANIETLKAKALKQRAKEKALGQQVQDLQQEHAKTQTTWCQAKADAEAAEDLYMDALRASA